MPYEWRGPRPAAVAAQRPRVLVCGWAGAGNLGDELLTAWAVDRIEAEGAHAVVSTRSVADTAARHPTATPTPWGPRGWREMLRADAVIVGPGGIIQDRTSLWSLPGHLVKAIVARVRRRPVAGVGLGALELRLRPSRWFLRLALGRAVAVVARDPESAAALGRAGVAATVGADVVFDLVPLGRVEPGADPPRPDHELGDGPGHVVVAVGPGVRSGTILPAAANIDRFDAEAEAVADAVAVRIGRTGERVELAAFRGERDREALARIRRRLGRDLPATTPGRVADLGDDIESIRRSIATARAVVTSRYHAAVLGLVEGTPVLCRSSEPKLVALAAAVGDDRRMRMVRDWADVAAGDGDASSADGDIASAGGEGVDAGEREDPGRGRAPSVPVGGDDVIGDVGPAREAVAAVVRAARVTLSGASATPSERRSRSSGEPTDAAQ